MTLLEIEQLAVDITFVAAGAAMIVFLLQLVLKKDALKSVGMVGMGVALVGSLVTLVCRGMIAQHVPWSNLWESMIFMLFGTLAFYFIVEVWYKPRNFGLFAAPLVLLLIGGASILPPGLKAAAPLMPALQSYWIKIHTSAILLSYGAFTISFAASVAYFILAWRAKQQVAATPALATAAAAPAGSAAAEPLAAAVGGTAAWVPDGLGGKAPAADAVPSALAQQMDFFDELTYRLILFGFPLLMFGIITGAMWANGAWGTYWSWDPKETWSLITWFIYAAYLHARLARDWTGAKAAGLSAVGFVSMIVTYIGVNALSSGLHSYGFFK